MRIPVVILLMLAFPSLVAAQLLQLPTGANRSDVSWRQIQTAHFTIVYHDGLEEFGREAATIAESVYPVVTGNLGTVVEGRTLLYLSDLDDVENAVAVNDWFIYIWMRGILADGPFGGVRASGSAKWLRTVITHEFTHTVIARATSTWLNIFSPIVPGVPRWFNEGTARFMEPDGWTPDLDMVVRVAAVNGRLGYGGLTPGRLDGTLLYETGHSIVRYMALRFGVDVLARIVNAGKTLAGYDFELAVRQTTGLSMSEIYADWLRTVTVLYGAEYAPRSETTEITPPLFGRFEYVAGIRFSPDGSRVALLAGERGGPLRLMLTRRDSASGFRTLTDESGFEADFSWSPDGRRLVLSKQRYGPHGGLVHDLYVLDVDSQELRRLTDGASLSDPDWSPTGERIVAVRRVAGRDNLVTVDPAAGTIVPVTRLRSDVQFSTPVWSPDGSHIAVGVFDSTGRRDIEIVEQDGRVRRLTNDSAIDRYPVWSPDGQRVAFTSYSDGVPNVKMVDLDGSDLHYVTDVAGGVYTEQWLPGSDSVVVISLDSRDKIVPHLIGADRRTVPVAVAPVRDRYSAWRTMRLPLQVPERSKMSAASVSDSGDYSSLAHIRPLVPIVPFWGGDPPVDGRGGGIRPAIGTGWADPMAKHLFGAYVDYGTATHEFGGEFIYFNATLPVTLKFVGKYHPSSRFLFDRTYYEDQRGLNVRGSYLLHAPNSLSVSHEFSIGAKYRSLGPINREEYVGAGTDPSRVPVAAELVELTASYTYSSSTFLGTARYRRSEPSLGSTIGYDHLSTQLGVRYPLFGSGVFSILGSLKGAAHWGGQLPQEFVGIDRNGILENDPSFDDFIVPQSVYHVRGVRRYRFGDRVAVGSVEIVQELPLLGRIVPPLASIPFEFGLFAEAGSAWYSSETALRDISILAGYGVEARAEYLPNLWFSAGLAFEMKRSPRRDFYVEVGFGL